MKNLKLALALAALCCVAACSKSPEVVPNDKTEPDNPVTDSTVVTTGPDYSGLTAENHPRIIFTDSDFESMAALYSTGTNTYFSKIHSIILTVAKSFVGAEDLERVLTGKRLLTVSQTAMKRILCCAYAYKMTGESQYLEQAEHDIQTVCGFSDWNAITHFLDAGEMAAAVGLAYDWLYNDLTASTRSAARNALNNFAFHPALYESPDNDFYSEVNNWNSVCNGGLVCAALAVYESLQSDSKKIIEKALSSNVACMAAGYAPDGNYPEGYSYWNYGTMFEVLMLTALETTLGSDNGLSASEGFSTSGQYMINMEGPSGYCFNYSDCTLNNVASFPQWYFAWKFGDLSVLYMELDKISSKYQNAAEARLLPVVAWYASRIEVSGVKAPTGNIFHGDGLTPVVAVHDTWTMDADDKFLGIKGGKGTTDHAHLDAGSFVFDAEGLRWAFDLVRQEYSTLESYISLWNYADGSQRWTSFRLNNFNHNTLTVNDAYHKSAGVASFNEIIDSDGRRGAVIDLTEPLRGEVSSAVRTIYIEGDDLVIEDSITALTSKAANVRWTMVTPAVPAIEYGAITLRQGKKTRYLTYSSSTGNQISWETWSTQSSNSWDESNDGYYECGYTLTVNAHSTATITVRLTPTDPLD